MDHRGEASSRDSSKHQVLDETAINTTSPRNPRAPILFTRDQSSLKVYCKRRGAYTNARGSSGHNHRRRAVVRHGLGGIGKTQLAIEYAHRHRKDYSTSVWLDARDETAINQSFARLAERILSYDPLVNDISIAVKSQDKATL